MLSFVVAAQRAGAVTTVAQAPVKHAVTIIYLPASGKANKKD